MKKPKREIQELGYGISLVEMSGGEIHLIDTKMEEIVGRYQWHQSHDGYAHARNKDKKMIKLHRFVMSAQPGQIVDHWNKDKSDSRLENLRFCTSSQNHMNRPAQRNNKSGYKGVSYNKDSGKWVAHIGVNRKQFHLGYFYTPEEAHAAYCVAALTLHGDFHSS